MTTSQAKADCDALAPFNAEGAAAVTTGTTTDLWIGLRAPLLEQHPSDPSMKRLAMLLHLSSPSAYKFDRVVLLDLDGRGVRELAVVGGMIYVIAGPERDEKACFGLLRFPASDLAGTDVIRPESIGCLPSSSEGLAVSGERLFVTIDGDAKDFKSTGVCKIPSGFMALSLGSL